MGQIPYRENCTEVEWNPRATSLLPNTNNEQCSDKNNFYIIIQSYIIILKHIIVKNNVRSGKRNIRIDYWERKRNIRIYLGKF